MVTVMVNGSLLSASHEAEDKKLHCVILEEGRISRSVIHQYLSLAVVFKHRDLHFIVSQTKIMTPEARLRI